MRIHLDPVGGVAGDMFIGAMLQAFPDLTEGMLAAIRAAGLPDDLACRVEPHSDSVLSGNRFRVDQPHILRHRDHEHRHVPFVEIRARLAESRLEPATRRRAGDIFSLLAQAESRVHAVAVDRVSFHELGGWDSIADIVGAAYLIEHSGAAHWTIGAIPMGSGRVATEHGELPVPTPATALLLQGMRLMDDGRAGERVTPTGAAIIRHLDCAQDGAQAVGHLTGIGYGFGTRTFPGISNVLRVLVLQGQAAAGEWGTELIEVLEFEVDDQSPEDLAAGLERLRAIDGVVDVVQFAGVGKKGRLTIRIQALVRPGALARAIEACFAQTSTLGLRHHSVQRAVLSRREAVVATASRPVRAKIAARPGAVETVKVDSDAIAAIAEDREQRQRLRLAVEGELLGGNKA